MCVRVEMRFVNCRFGLKNICTLILSVPMLHVSFVNIRDKIIQLNLLITVNFK
jgi:hypothetical protein